MRSISIGAAIFALPALIHAVSLSDLVPRAQNLPQACNKIYTSQIPQCDKNDFLTHQCSQSCIQALFALVDPIKDACGNQGITGQNLIVAYLLDVGPEQICSDIGDAPSSTPPKGNKKTTAISSGVMTASSMAPSDSHSLVFDTSKTGASTSPTTSPGKKPLPSQLNTNDRSGGGSPFDTAGNLSGAGSVCFSAAAALLSAIIILFTSLR